METLEAILSIQNRKVVGLRIWPELNFNDILDENAMKTHAELLKTIQPLNLDYVHSTQVTDTSQDVFDIMKTHFSGTSIVNGGFSLATAKARIANDEADLVAFGAPFIANPNLVEHFKDDIALNIADEKTYYTAGAVGYTDYI